MRTSSQDSVSIYVRNGLGAGLAVQTPELLQDTKLRVLPLSGFPSIPIGVFWRGKLGEIAQVFVDELADRAKSIFGRPEAEKRQPTPPHTAVALPGEPCYKPRP